MLRQIMSEYELSDLNWIIKDQIFLSESGKKRIRIWNDKQLLEWHVKWRDEISRQSGILLDRMIRTKAGEPFIICTNGWATIHDEIEAEFPTQGKEVEWGRLFGTALAYGLKHNDPCPNIKNKQEIPLKAVKQSLDQLTHIDSMTKLILERSYFEAQRRNHQAMKLSEHIQTNKLPILLPFNSFTNAKEVFFHLFWVSGEDQPVRGYEPIRNLLEKWFEKNGEGSTLRLLETINNFYSLKEEQGSLLLAQLLIPYEFKRTVTQLWTQEKETVQIMDEYFKSWEITRKLVLLLSDWLEKDREKAVADAYQ